MNTEAKMPPEVLEKRAAEQRRSLHNDVQQLRTAVEAEVRGRIDDVREKIDPEKNVRKHFAPIAGATAMICLSLGYGFAGIFTKH